MISDARKEISQLSQITRSASGQSLRAINGVLNAGRARSACERIECAAHRWPSALTRCRIDDPCARHLRASLLPATARPADAPALFLNHVVLALTAHVAPVYRAMDRARNTRSGGLTPHQERRARELMAESISEDISLLHLATECGLSPRHFARAFRHSTGLSPHRWLMQHRVERAPANFWPTGAVADRDRAYPRIRGPESLHPSVHGCGWSRPWCMASHPRKIRRGNEQPRSSVHFKG